MKIRWLNIAELTKFNNKLIKFKDQEKVNDVSNKEEAAKFLEDNPDVTFEIHAHEGQFCQIFFLKIAEKIFCFLLNKDRTSIMPLFKIQDFLKLS